MEDELHASLYQLTVVAGWWLPFVGCFFFVWMCSRFHHWPCANRPGLAEFGRFPCHWLLERIRFLQGGEAFSAHGTLGLQGQGDWGWALKGRLQGETITKDTSEIHFDSVSEALTWNFSLCSCCEEPPLSPFWSHCATTSCRLQDAQWWPAVAGCPRRWKPGCRTPMLSIGSS